MLVELLDDVDSRVQGQLRVQNTTSNTKLLKEELEAVASVDVANEDDALALDQLELEDDVGKEELLVFTTSSSTLAVIRSYVTVYATYLATNWVIPSPSASFSLRSSNVGSRRKIPLSVSTSSVRVALIIMT